MSAFDKLSHIVDGEPRILSDPPLIEPIKEIEDENAARKFFERIHALLRELPPEPAKSDRRHLLERGSGWSTLPARWWEWAVSAPERGSCCCSAATASDPLFLQAKEAQSSVLERFVSKSHYGANCGERVVAGQHLMQAQQRHLLGLGSLSTESMGCPTRLLRPSTQGLEGLHRDPEQMVPNGLRRLREGVRFDPRLGPTPAPATASPSPPT